MNQDCISIWRYENAPQELQDLSTHGGDEDYLAYVPKVCTQDMDLLLDGWFGRMVKNGSTGEYTIWDGYNGSAFGICSVSRHELPDGALVFIGAHA